MSLRSNSRCVLNLLLLLSFCGPGIALAQPSADIAAILDQQKPDPRVVDRLRKSVQAELPGGLTQQKQAFFYFDRCQAHSTLGDFRKAIADCEKAVELARGVVSVADFARIQQSLAINFNYIGEIKQSLEIFLRAADEVEAGGERRFLFNFWRHITERYIRLGDMKTAELYVEKNRALLEQARSWPNYDEFRKPNWQADVELGRARLLEEQGRYREAEAAYAVTESARREAIKFLHKFGPGIPPPRAQLEQVADAMLAAQGRMKARQGRVAEGEADIRRALLRRLEATGKYNLQTAVYIGMLANLLVEQGRFADAERLTRVQIEIRQTMGAPRGSQTTALAVSQLASVLSLQDRWAEAAKVYADLDVAIADWEPRRREGVELNIEQVLTHLKTGNVADGLAMAQRLYLRNRERFGDEHFDVGVAQGVLAVVLRSAGRADDALAAFEAAIPTLTAVSRATDNDDPTFAAGREKRIQTILESYIGLLAARRSKSTPEVTFALGDAIRGRSVQNAIAASAARSLAQEGAMAGFIREEQDLEKQVSAHLGVLNAALSLPTESRVEDAIDDLRRAIVALQTRLKAAHERNLRAFPGYAALVEPKPATLEEIIEALRPGETFLSFFFGQEESFVWAVPKDGPSVLAPLAITARELEAKVNKLREALEPAGTFVTDIPAYDTKLAYELFRALLLPVESAWKASPNLIVVTNGALGLLPLSLLPTEAIEVKDGEPLFAAYKKVRWLARTHAVTAVPSAAALRTLRALPPSKPSRDKLIAFGDPLFSKKQAEEAEQPTVVADAGTVTTRGIRIVRRSSPQLQGVDSAELALLPRLPDTSDELKAIAIALEADPTKVLNLGKEANEKKVKSIDLSGYKILAFATHGLVPGDLNGLRQPALALSAPEVSGADGDGLLTMDEILALKLDADWVVLSACNTGSGAGAGAEAASGLGRAFFYAGTRALLVTNWSVHSASARDLVADLFHRQAQNPKLSRGEALRQAMIALIDGEGFKDDSGKTLFSYAHPLFWAPYSIIGDGGAN